MSYAILAAVLILLMGVIACLILWSMLVAERAKVAPLQKALGEAQKAHSDLALEDAATRERLEAVIDGLKKEVATIEAKLQTCRDPAVIRDRLVGLLGSVQPSVPVPPVPTPSSTGVPPRDPTKP